MADYEIPLGDLTTEGNEHLINLRSFGPGCYGHIHLVLLLSSQAYTQIFDKQNYQVIRCIGFTQYNPYN